MINVMERARSKNYPAIRLLQASYHNRSLALYTSLGFDVREPISTLQGKPIQAVIPGNIRERLRRIWNLVMQSAEQYMVMIEMVSEKTV